MHQSVNINVGKKSSLKVGRSPRSNRVNHSGVLFKSIETNSFGGGPYKIVIKEEQRQKQSQRRPQEEQNNLMSNLKSKTKQSVEGYIRDILNVNYITPEHQEYIEVISRATSVQQLMESLFYLFRCIYQTEKQKLSHSTVIPKKSENEIVMVLRTKEAKILRLVKDKSMSPQRSRGKSGQKNIELQEYNERLKKQIFELKDEKQMLQKKVLEIVEEFKNRKSFYMAEIKKLTDIINMSSFDVRSLVLEKTKQAKQLFSKYEMVPNNQGEGIDINLHTADKAVEFRQSRQRYQPVMRSNMRDGSFGENERSNKAYNRQISMLQGIRSVEHLEQFKNDNNAIY